MSSSALGLVAALAALDGEPIAIEWNAPPSCPSPEAVDDALQRRTTTGSGQPVRVRADVDARSDRFVADIAVETEWGASQRHVEASDCTSIADTTVLIAAIAADPLAAVAGPVPTVEAPSSLPRVEPEPVAPPRPPARRIVMVEPKPTTIEAPRQPRPRPHGLVRVDGAFGFGLVPQPSGGFGGAIGAAWRHVEVGLSAMWWPPRPTARTSSGAWARVDLMTIGPYVCGSLGSRTWSVGLCGAAETGFLRARPRDVAAPTDRTSPWVAFGLGPRLRVGLHARVGLVAGLEGMLFPYRPQFVVEHEGELHLGGIAGFRARLGLEVRWP